MWSPRSRQLVEGEEVFADVVLADVDLEALATLLELREACLALDSVWHDASAMETLTCSASSVFSGGGHRTGRGSRDGVGWRRSCWGTPAGEGDDLVALLAA